MEIAKKLRVKHVVEGSVRKMGDRLRVNAQLIDGTNGQHIWAERYDGDLAEIFDFQDDIREQIVSALQVSLTPADKMLTERKSTDSVEAYDLCLKGRANLYLFTPEHVREAMKCLEKAIEIDPNFADAYAYLAHCHFYGWVEKWPGFDDTLDQARDLAEKGVSVDTRSAISVMRLGWIQTWSRHYDDAIANLETALTLAPNNAEIYAPFGNVLNYWGDPERGLEMLEKAFELDTLAPPLWEMYIGISHLLLRQYDQALTRLNSVAERAPKFTHSYEMLAWAYVELDRLDDARDAIINLSSTFRKLRGSCLTGSTKTEIVSSTPCARPGCRKGSFLKRESWRIKFSCQRSAMTSVAFAICPAYPDHQFHHATRSTLHIARGFPIPEVPGVWLDRPDPDRCKPLCNRHGLGLPVSTR
jgi:tetratricopeptide (TPR) repeat protein